MASIVTLLLFLVTQSGDGRAPDILRSTNPNRRAPLWIAASKAVTPEGELAREHFEDYELRFQERAREVNRSRTSSNGVSGTQTCFGEFPAEIPAPSAPLKELARAPAVVEGRVTGRTVGFFEGVPGALLSVRVDRTAQRDQTSPIADEVLVYYPEADFNVGKDAYCIRPATHPARPRAGDRILVFAYGPPVETTGRVLYVQASKHLIFETADGRLIPPAALRKELTALGLQSVAEVMARLEREGLRTEQRLPTMAE